MSILLGDPGGADQDLSNISRRGISKIVDIASYNSNSLCRANRIAGDEGDIYITSANPSTSGQVLVSLNPTTVEWGQAPSPDFPTFLSELTDVTISGPTNNQALIYNVTTATWQNNTISADNVSDGIINTMMTVSQEQKYDSVVRDVGDIRLIDGLDEAHVELTGGILEFNTNTSSLPTYNGDQFVLVNGAQEVRDKSLEASSTSFYQGSNSFKFGLSTPFDDNTLIRVKCNGVAEDMTTAQNSQAMSNKTLLNSSNQVRATALAVGTGYVEIDSLSVPANGSVLQYDQASNEFKYEPLPVPEAPSTQVVDADFRIYSSLDNSNKLWIDLSNQTGGTLATQWPNDSSVIQTVVTAEATQQIYSKDLTDLSNDTRANRLSSTGFGSVYDLTLNSPTNGEVLKWDNSTVSYTNKPNNLTTLQDVLITSQSSTSYMFYNTSLGKWSSQILSTSRLNDWRPLGLVNDQFMTWQTSQWTNTSVLISTSHRTRADRIAYTGGSCIITSVAPVSGQVLTASSATSAFWSTPTTQAVTSQYSDASFRIYKSSDVASGLSFDLSNLTNQVQLSVPNGTTTLQEITLNTAIQTLTNKTMTDVNSKARADRIATGADSVLISLSSPVSGQVLQATSATTAAWATVTSGGGVSPTSIDTFTNKTITDISNICRADRIATSGSSVLITSVAPVSGQWLQASSATTASWTNITDSTFIIQDNVDPTKTMNFQLDTLGTGTAITLNPPAQNGILVVGQDLQGIANDLTILGCSETITPMLVSTVYLPTTLNDILNPQLFIDNSASYFPQITNVPTGQISDSLSTSVANLLLGQDGNTGTNYTISTVPAFYRLNLSFENYGAFTANQIVLTAGHQIAGANSTHTIQLYGSNTTQVSSTSDTYAGMALLYTSTFLPSNVTTPETFTFTMTIGSPYKYYSLRVLYGGLSRKLTSIIDFRIRSAGGSYIPQYIGTDYNLAVDATTGYPSYTRIAGNTSENCLINQGLTLTREAYSRLYPVIRGKNDIRINDARKLSDPGVAGLLFVDNVLQVNVNATQTLSNKTYSMVDTTLREVSGATYIYNKNVPTSLADQPASGLSLTFNSLFWQQDLNFGRTLIYGANGNTSACSYNIQLNSETGVNTHLQLSTDGSTGRFVKLGASLSVNGTASSTNVITGGVDDQSVAGTYTIASPDIAIVNLNSETAGCNCNLPTISATFPVGYSVLINTWHNTSGSVSCSGNDRILNDPAVSSVTMLQKTSHRFTVISPSGTNPVGGGNWSYI
jgi:hypothetical protein